MEAAGCKASPGHVGSRRSRGVMDRLASRVAIITGSTSGIGRACAERFAGEGACVVINGFPPERGEQVAAEIGAKGGSARYCQADVRRSEDLRRLIQFTIDA